MEVTAGSTMTVRVEVCGEAYIALLVKGGARGANGFAAQSNAVDLIADNEWFRWYDPRGKNLGVKRRGSIPFAGLCRDCGTTALSAEFGGFLARACTKPLDYLRLPFLAPAWRQAYTESEYNATTTN